MKFTKIEEITSNSKIIKCNKLTNDMIFMKYDINTDDIIKISNDEFVALIYKGEVCDTKEENGIYLVENEVSKIEEEWKDLHIRKTEEDDLCVVFLNRDEIKGNKFLLEIETKNLNIKNKEKYVYLKGHYDFKIENPKMFFSKIIGIRRHFTKQELIEKIRKYVLKSIKKGINDMLQEYNLDIKDLPKNSKKLELKLKGSKYDEKLLEYGVKLVNFDISNLEIVDKKIKNF